jgi:hypothetical protein
LYHIDFFGFPKIVPGVTFGGRPWGSANKI